MNQERRSSSSEELVQKLTSVMKRLSALERDMVLLGDKVYMKTPLKPAESVTPIQAKLILGARKAKVGEDVNVLIELVNGGGSPTFLTKIEEILPLSFEMVAKPDYCRLEGTYLDMNRRRLDPLTTEEVRLTMRPFGEGTFVIMPKIAYVDETSRQMFCEPEPVTIDILENILPNRVSTGYKDLDSLLLGGMPERYAVILTSISCDERDLLIKRFLEAGAYEGQVTFYVTIEARGVKTLSEEFQSNFYVFICNPQADTITKGLPNMFRLKGVENLTNVNIALTSAFRKLGTSVSGPRRACIEIVSDVLLEHHATKTRRWLSGLIPDLRSKGFTTLAVMNPHMHPPEEVHAILDLFDGEINIYEKDSTRFLKIKKMYNQRYLESQLLLRKEKLRIVDTTKGGRWREF